MLMNEEFALPDISGYISAKEAAKILGISVKSVYRFVDEKRIPALRAGRSVLLPLEAVQQFKPNPIGRTRTQPPPWREYRAGSKLYITSIEASIREGQQTKLLKKLRNFEQEEQHMFPGTIARYVSQHNDTLRVLLIWKDTEMPDESTRRQAIEAFKNDVHGMLNWDSARIEMSEVVIHT